MKFEVRSSNEELRMKAVSFRAPKSARNLGGGARPHPDSSPSSRLGMTRLFLILLATACASSRSDVGTAKSPSTQWTPPANAVPAATPASRNDLTLPPNFTPGMPITLAQVVDIALANNSTTRLAWLQARAAQAGVGSAESAYLPEVDLDAQIANTRTTSTPAQTTLG